MGPRLQSISERSVFTNGLVRRYLGDGSMVAAVRGPVLIEVGLTLKRLEMHGTNPIQESGV